MYSQKLKYNIERTSKLASATLTFCFLLALFSLPGLSGCDNKDVDFPSAPLGEKSALEKLAEAYRAQSNTLPVSPVAMTAQSRKSFLITVFQQAGFSYSKTLNALAKLEPGDGINQHHRDLAQLLRLPHHALDTSVKKDIYSAEELKLINRIERF